jgi:hypothetical protein
VSSLAPTEVAASPATSNAEAESVAPPEVSSPGQDTEPPPDDPGRLTLDQALAELDRQPAHLLAVENEHGFVFGNPDGERGPGRPTVAAVCSTAGCDRQGRLVQLHEDTVQPAHCGSCGAVIHCDHVSELRRERSGTLAAVVEHIITGCTRCGTELDRVSKEVGALPLDQIPVGILDQPLDRG